MGDQILFQRFLRLRGEVALSLKHDVLASFLTLDHASMHFFARGHRVTPLIQLLLTGLAFLANERVNFDNQLGAIEATLHAKEHDYEELLLMSHDASHAKDVARAELV